MLKLLGILALFLIIGSYNDGNKEGKKMGCSSGSSGGGSAVTHTNIEPTTLEGYKTGLQNVLVDGQSMWVENTDTSYRMWWGIPLTTGVLVVIKDSLSSCEEFMSGEVNEAKITNTSNIYGTTINKICTQEEGENICAYVWCNKKNGDKIAAYCDISPLYTLNCEAVKNAYFETFYT